MLTRLSIAWLIFVPAATLWQVITYSGLYRWLCEWQLAQGGEYEGLLTALVPAVLLIAPALLYLRLRPQGAVHPAAVPVSPADAEKLAVRVLMVVGVGGTLVCAALLLWAQRLPGGSGPSVDVDLAKLGDAMPPLGRVTLTGSFDPAHVATKTIDGKVAVDNEHDLYAPMIVPGNAEARIFIKQYVSGDVTQPMPSGPGGGFRGVLIEGGLPGDMIRQFERTGVRISEPYYVLMTGRDGARTPFYVAAGLAGFVAALGLLPLLFFLIGKAFRRTRGVAA
jgi:hypothetical protein